MTYLAPRLRAHCVYRTYGGNGELLYIGCTHDPMLRLSQWSSALRKWTYQVEAVTFEWFATKAEARIAEAAAIRTEHPRSNVVHNGTDEKRERQARAVIERTMRINREAAA